MKEIVQYGNPVLREVASYIQPKDILSKEIQQHIVDMKQSLSTQKDGVALAAPQIGMSLQIFVVTSFVFEDSSNQKLVYINPEMIQSSNEKKWLDEGCLSCRWKVGQVERSLSVTVRAYDEHGKPFEIEADGLLAHIFQHEIDHLNGTLFIDKARKLRDMTEAEIQEATQGQ